MRSSKADKLSELLKIQLKLDKPHWSNYSRNQLEAIGVQFTRLLCDKECFDNLLRLNQLEFFEIFIPELADLKGIPQHKQESKDAFYHSILVASKINYTPMLRWAGLLHDIGKANYTRGPKGELDFRGHEFHGSKLARGILKRMKIKQVGDICRLVQFHTHPLDYQRQPNWRTETIVKFADKYEHLAISLIDLAIADKIASSNNGNYLEPLYELRVMIEDITNDKKRVY